MAPQVALRVFLAQPSLTTGPSGPSLLVPAFKSRFRDQASSILGSLARPGYYRGTVMVLAIRVILTRPTAYTWLFHGGSCAYRSNENCEMRCDGSEPAHERLTWARPWSQRASRIANDSRKLATTRSLQRAAHAPPEFRTARVHVRSGAPNRARCKSERQCAS